jgi:hypothetical protein
MNWVYLHEYKVKKIALQPVWSDWNEPGQLQIAQQLYIWLITNSVSRTIP